jgi:DNA-binding PadR family transcriptional regulator
MAILALLYEAPMHPYRMQQLIKERGKDKIINVRRRASLYQTISQLEKSGLIQVKKTISEENRPDRTLYELTDKGLRTIRDWLRDALATPAQEFPEFPAAVSFIALLTPEVVLRQLKLRETALNDQLADLDTSLQSSGAFLPRLFLLEDEYLRAVLEAELNWVRSVIDDLRNERLTWDEAWLQQFIAPDVENYE